MLAVGILIASCTKDTTYIGMELTGAHFICKSNKISAGGFWNDIKSMKVVKEGFTNTETQTTTWKIKMKDNLAEVTRFSGSTGTIEDPQIFGVEKTPMTNGLLLVSQRNSGESPEVITIDPENGSFVYSTQNVNVFYNRANIFYGECYPYQ